MNRFLLLIPFLFIYVVSYPQTDFQKDSRIHPILKQALNQKKGYIPFGRSNTSRLINLAVLYQPTHTMNWFTCHGRLFDSTRLTDQEYEQIILKQVDPFLLYQHICEEYLINIAAAETVYRVYGAKAVDGLGFDYRAIFAAKNIQQAKTPLQKLMAIENIRKRIITQLVYLNCVDPNGLFEAPQYKINKQWAGTMIQTKDSTIYYNIDPACAVAKIGLYKNSPEKLYIYNRQTRLIDSMTVLPAKYDLLLKEKTDVFLLYRGWLEMEWKGAMECYLRQLQSSGKKDSTIYHQTNTKDANEIEKELYSQIGAVEAKINILISPETRSIEQSIYETYKNEKSEIMYLPSLGVAYSLIATRGNKEYELTNHLGNVLVTVTDKKLGHSSNNSTVDHYDADVVNAQDYYPFGTLQPGRSYFSSTGIDRYRYGFNGKENDNEVKGEGNQQDYGMRIYDPRLGRFLSVDPLTSKYSMLTPYQFTSNSPISGVDLDGLEFYFAADGTYLGRSKYGGTQIRVATEYQADPKDKSQLIMKNYKDIDKVDATIASKVYATIYKREVKSPHSPGVSASTKTPNAFAATDPDTKHITVYYQQTMSSDDGSRQKLMTDYYNAASTLNHEDDHAGGLHADGFSHFQVELNEFRNKFQSSVSKYYKENMMANFQFYLSQEVENISQFKAAGDKTSENYYRARYEKDLQTFNRLFKKNLKSFFEVIEEKSKPNKPKTKS